jgi:hypothetical protein
MSKRNERDARLLADTFHEGWDEGQPAKFALIAAAHARRRRATRRALTGVYAVLAVGSLLYFSARPDREPPVEPSTTGMTTPVRSYEIISDEQLLAQVHDRPLMVVMKSDGKKEIVVLENRPAL